jgi:hypothetical protein
MRIEKLQLWRSLILMAYEAGRISKETAQAKCRVLTRAIEKLAEKSKPVQTIGQGAKTP